MASITLLTALKDFENALDYTVLNDEANGALATLAALIRHEVGTFDGIPIYANNVLIGIDIE